MWLFCFTLPPLPQQVFKSISTWNIVIKKKNIPTSSSRRINRKFWLAGVKLSRRGKLVTLEGGQTSKTVKCNFAIFTTKMQKGNKDLLTKRASHFAPHRMLCTTGAHLAAAQTSERKTAKKAI